MQQDQQTIADYGYGDAPGSPTHRYVYASYIDEPVVRKAAGTSGTIHYYHRNQQFSITAVTTSSGSVAERYAYTAYGQPTILDSSGSILASSSLGNRYTYTGREWDQTLSLYHFRARWMSGLAGRFMGRDPIGYSSGLLTIYAFIDANTLANLDPHGLMSVMLPLPNPMFNPDIMPFGSATGGCVDTVTSIQRVAKCRVPGFVYGTRIVSVACDSGLYASCCSSVPGVISSSGVIVTKGTRTCNAGEEQNALAPGGAVITALSKCPARPSINLNPLVIAWAMSQKDVETQEMSLEYEDLPLTEKVNKAYDCKKATKHQLNLAGIFHEHSFKDEWGGQPNSRFEICACKDGSIVLARTGQCGSPGEKIETDAVWK